jgi:hypothetical protein
MITLPQSHKAFDYENNFYLSCDVSRISKILAQYELFKLTLDIPGAIVECGVFKGASLARLAMFRELLSNSIAKKIVAFDAFGAFPATQFEADKKVREKFITDAGEQGIDTGQLEAVLKNKGVLRNVELIKGDVNVTVPKYMAENPQLKISFLNLDTDVYEPAVTILKHFYPRLSRGGVMLLDDYGVFPGETQAVDEYFRGEAVAIRKLPFAMTPSYIVKKD